MNSKHLAALVAVAAFAAPTAALAGDGHGKSDEAKPHHDAAGKGQAKPKNAVFKGTVVSADVAAGTVIIHVDKANKWGRRFKDTDVSFTVAGVKKVVVADTNADGKTDLADVKSGDSAKAHAKITKDAVPPLAASKLKVAAPAPAEPDDD